jgi:hypothetical protein
MRETSSAPVATRKAFCPQGGRIAVAARFQGIMSFRPASVSSDAAQRGFAAPQKLYVSHCSIGKGVAPSAEIIVACSGIIKTEAGFRA